MFCANCGKKVPVGAKFCPECDSVVAASGAEKNGNKPRKKRWSLVLLGILLLLFGGSFIIYAIQGSGKGSQNNNSVGIIFGFFILAALLAAAIFSIKVLISRGIKSAKYLFHHPVWGILSVAILAILIGAGIYAFSRPDYKRSVVVLPDIQNSLVDVAAAKLMGDAITAKKATAGATMAKVNEAVAAAAKKLNSLSVSPLLKAYQQSALAWSNQIAVAAQITEIWKDLPSQPGDFPLALSDSQATQLFQDSIKKIAGLKQDGHGAVLKKDRDAMRLVAAKLVMQQHWLNGLLHSQTTGSLSSRLVFPVFASTLDVPPVGPGTDVTCQVCSDPKVHWTAQLRKQYGCDTRCKPQQPAQQQQPQNQSQTNQTQGQNQTPQTPPSAETKDNGQNQQPENQEKPYSYEDVKPRKICIGRGGTGTGPNNGSATNVYCVEEAISSTNEIAASAIGFAQGKSMTVNNWDKQFAEIDKIPLPEVATGQTGQQPSTPSAAGGHLGEGMGTISTGEPIQPPKPEAKKEETKPWTWDGNYTGTQKVTCSDGSERSSTNGVSVENNKLDWETMAGVPYTGSGEIDANGYAQVQYDWGPHTYQFYRSNSKAFVKINSTFSFPAVFGAPAFYCQYVTTAARMDE